MKTPEPEITIRQIEPTNKVLAVLREPRILIGKRPECHVQFQGVTGISGIHAVLTLDQGRWHVTDPGAARGVKVGEQQIGYNVPVPIHSGARLRLGRVLLEVTYT